MNTEELELTKKAVELLNDRNLKDLKELLAEQNPADISNIFEEVPRTDVILKYQQGFVSDRLRLYKDAHR